MIERMIRGLKNDFIWIRFLMIGDREFQKQSGLSISNAIEYAKFFSRSHNAVIRVHDEAGNMVETHEHAGDFKEW
jgi:hypothetical protein